MASRLHQASNWNLDTQKLATFIHYKGGPWCEEQRGAQNWISYLSYENPTWQRRRKEDRINTELLKSPYHVAGCYDRVLLGILDCRNQLLISVRTCAITHILVTLISTFFIGEDPIYAYISKMICIYIYRVKYMYIHNHPRTHIYIYTCNVMQCNAMQCNVM